jgi:HlyD family secretion protein
MAKFVVNTRLGGPTVAAAMALIALACGANAASRPGVSSGTVGEPDPPGEATVRAGKIEDVFLLTGELNALHSLDLVTPRSDTWQVQIKWIAEDGSELQQGDRAIEFDNTQILQTIEEKKLRLIQSEIDLESREASLRAEEEEKQFALERAEIGAEKARAEAAVPEDLLERRKWQEQQAALRSAEAALKKAQLAVEAFRISSKSDLAVLRIAREKAARDIESAQASLDGLALKAPAAGIFVIGDYWREERKFQVGDTTWPGQTIATIPDLSAMEVVGLLPEVDEGKIAPGMPARCVLDTYPDRVFAGKIEEVASIADEGGFRTRGGFRVKVSLEKSDPALMRPGMSVRVEVVRRAWDRALIVPKAAIHREASAAFVHRAGGGPPVEVRLAACTPTDCVVESGIEEGARVEIR